MTAWLTDRTRVTPNATALIIGEQRWSYLELNKLTNGFCQYLADTVQSEQIVGVLMPNNLTYVCLIHAVARLGAVLLPLNTRLTSTELGWQLEHTGCELLICDDTFADTGEQLAVISEQLSVISCQLSVVSEQSSATSTSSEQALNPQPLRQAQDKHSVFSTQSSTQSIIFTSGTTGRPKGVELTFDNHFFSAMASAMRLGLDVQDCWLSCLPLFHVGGQAVVLRSCLYGTAVNLHPKFDTAAVSHCLDTQAISLISLVPTMVYRLLDYRGKRPWPSSLRHVLAGGAAASPDLVARCHALNIPLSTTYGLTEAASQVATMRPEDVRRKPGSVGKALMFTEVRVLDEQGQDCPAGELGEIVVSGPTVMDRYFKNLEATTITLKNNQLHTGDIGYLDEDGDLWVTQRRSDIIVTGGENVYPAEVEAVLMGQTAVSQACVVGIPDPEWGQKVAAMIVLQPESNVTIDELLVYCRQHLAGYKLPRLIRFVKSLPLIGSGKIDRKQVKALLS